MHKQVDLDCLSVFLPASILLAQLFCSLNFKKQLQNNSTHLDPIKLLV